MDPNPCSPWLYKIPSSIAGTASIAGIDSYLSGYSAQNQTLITYNLVCNYTKSVSGLCVL